MHPLTQKATIPRHMAMDDTNNSCMELSSTHPFLKARPNSAVKDE